MKFKDWMTRKNWVPVSAEHSPGGDLLNSMERESREHQDRLRHALCELLSSERLIVFCGSGTSLELNFRDGRPLPIPIAPGAADLWKAVKTKIDSTEAGLFQKVLNYVNYNPAQSKESVENLLAACKISERFKSTPWVKNFLDKAEMEIARLCRFPEGEEDLSAHENLLRRIIQRPPDLPRTKIFTTNYDLCLEKAAANVACMIVDGFSYSAPREFDISFYAYDWVRRAEPDQAPVFVPNLVHLYKLHGSVDWEQAAHTVVKNPAPARPRLLYFSGDQDEFTMERPFLEIMSQFQVALRQPKTGLLIIGFGFNELNLAHTLIQSVRFNHGLRVVCANKDFDFENNPCCRTVERLVESGDPRLTLIQSSFGELVRILPSIEQKTAPAHPAEQSQEALLKLCA